MQIRIENSWKQLLSSEWDKPYFEHLCAKVRHEYQHNPPIYPRGTHIFRALDLCPVDRVRLVILGQDPYHGAGQAEGLSFSVPAGVDIPPSLRNIKHEILEDTGRASQIVDGHLMPWVEQGVLLLNSILTVRAGQAGSHQGLGWETFTDAVIDKLSSEREHLVFLLWGNYARRKGLSIDRSRHLVLEAAHPSPLSYTKFRGCKHFSQANQYLISHNIPPIVW